MRRTILLLAAAAALAACNSEKWTLQQSVDDLIGDIDHLLGGASLPGKHLNAIRDVHERKSWNFKAGADDPLEVTRRAVRGLSTCDYNSWSEAAIVVEILSSMADEHPSSLVRAEALDTLTRMAPWTLAAVVKSDHPTSDAEFLDGLKLLDGAVGKTDTDPAYTFQVATAVTALTNHPFDETEVLNDEATSNKLAARALTTQLRRARAALRKVNGKAVEGFEGDAGVRQALDRAYVSLSAAVIRLTLMKDALGDASDTTRVAAVKNLGALAPEGGAPVLRRVLLYDGFATVRREAARSMAAYPPAVSVPTLIDGLADEMADVRLASAHSLEMLSGKTFGDDRRAWVQWWQAQSGSKPSGTTSATDVVPPAGK